MGIAGMISRHSPNSGLQGYQSGDFKVVKLRKCPELHSASLGPRVVRRNCTVKYLLAIDPRHRLTTHEPSCQVYLGRVRRRKADVIKDLGLAKYATGIAFEINRLRILATDLKC